MFIINLRIMVPTNQSDSLINNLDILFVIDNTISMNAEDYENNNTRWHLSRLLQYFENYDIAVLELGTNNFGSMKQMSRLVKPSIAIINSIGTAHINNFKTKENILNEKMHIVDFMKDKKILYINAEDKYLKQVKESKNYKLLNYSLKDAWNMNQTNEGISFSTQILHFFK